MFYGRDQAAIHHARFGALADDAARLVLAGLAQAGIRSGTVADLGSGSGIFARALTDAGYDVIGVDISAAMVELARTTAPKASFSTGSLHDFDLPPVVAVTALREALNYATDARAGIAALERLANRVFVALAPGGLFAFDVATPGRAGATGRTERFHVDDGWALGVHAIEDAPNAALERIITIFAIDENQSRAAGHPVYRRSDERHVLHLFVVDEVRGVLARAGFEVEVREGYGAPATFPGWRVFIGRRPGASGSS